MAILGVGAGLPFLLVFSTLNLWLSEMGVSKTHIGLFAAIGVTYSVKVIWAPVIDHLKLPFIYRLGRRRSWLLLAQAGVAASLLVMSTIDPSEALLGIAIAGVCVAFSSATQDIALDAWRIEAVPLRLQGMMSASYIFGYRLGLLFAGAGALYIAEFSSWSTAYQAMAAIMMLPVVTVLLLANDGIDTQTRPFQFERPCREPWWLHSVTFGNAIKRSHGFCSFSSLAIASVILRWVVWRTRFTMSSDIQRLKSPTWLRYSASL